MAGPAVVAVLGGAGVAESDVEHPPITASATTQQRNRRLGAVLSSSGRAGVTAFKGAEGRQHPNDRTSRPYGTPRIEAVGSGPSGNSGRSANSSWYRQVYPRAARNFWQARPRLTCPPTGCAPG